MTMPAETASSRKTVIHGGMCTTRISLFPMSTQHGIGVALSGLGMGNLLWLIIVVLVVLWLAGWTMHIGGSLIHALVVIAVIVLLFQLITGRRAV
jgi:hypothetical protein